MTRLACFAAALLCGCGRYADFTLPPLPGGPNLTFAFDERPAPVLADDSGDALNPSVVTYAGYTNVYSVFRGGVWYTAVATSNDGLSWQKRGIALRPEMPWEGNYIAANGSALTDRDGLLYWYVAGPRNAGAVGLAQSTGLDRWRKRPRPVLAHGPFESWDETAVADPYVLRAAGYFYLYYLGQDRAVPPQQRLGLARSRDGVHWEKLRSNPILEPGPPGTFDEAGVGEPAVWQSGGFYWMLFTGRDFSERRRLGLARSRDGVHWTKLNAVFSGASAWDSQVICDPTVLAQGGAIEVWFGGGDVASPDENLHGKIGFALLRPVEAAETK